MTSCFHYWTEKEKKNFDCKCTQTDTFELGVVHFRGFNNTEFDSILVRAYKDTVLIDSFKIFVDPSKSDWDKENKRRSATILRTMKTKYKYQFIVPGQQPYELSNMKMIMWAEWTMTSENYGCVMGSFTLDGKKFEHCGNLCIEKHDTTSEK